MMLPISVLIPTRDCAALLPGHLRSLQAWIDLAEEVVVVDSDSKDNTVELIREGLTHARTRFLSPPPGLYPIVEFWNSKRPGQIHLYRHIRGFHFAAGGRTSS